MKQALMKWSLFTVIFFTGVQVLEASEHPTNPHWVAIQDQEKRLEVSFPRQPVHMTFDLPLESSEQVGHLDVYSAPFGKGLYMLTVLSSPLFAGNELEPNNFKDIFYNFIIKRMFYWPQIFQDHQIFKSGKIAWEGHPAMRFSLTYEDKQKTKKLSGLAILKERTLYTLFYLNSKDEFEEEFAHRFIDSLHFLEMPQ